MQGTQGYQQLGPNLVWVSLRVLTFLRMKTILREEIAGNRGTGNLLISSSNHRGEAFQGQWLPCSGLLGFSCSPSQLPPAAPPPSASQAEAELGKAFRIREPQACLLALRPAMQPQNKGSSGAGSPLVSKSAAINRSLRAYSSRGHSPLHVLCVVLAKAHSASLLLLHTGPAAHG